MAESTNLSDTEAQGQIQLSLRLFEESKLSFGKAREMTGLDIWDFQNLLGVGRIPVHYDLEEYEADLTTLKELDLL